METEKVESNEQEQQNTQATDETLNKSSEADLKTMFLQERQEKKAMSAKLAELNAKMRAIEEKEEIARLASLSEIEREKELRTKAETELQEREKQLELLIRTNELREGLEVAITQAGPSFSVDKDKAVKYLSKLGLSGDELKAEIQDFVETFKVPVKNKILNGTPKGAEISSPSPVPYKENVYSYTDKEMTYLRINEPDRYNTISKKQLSRR